ncbi:MAG TPA: GH116 family glycosyl hydrolase [Gemmatimonadales bacterium]
MRTTTFLVASLAATLPGGLVAQQGPRPVARFAIPESPIALTGDVRPGHYVGEVGRRAALFGDESGAFEAWTWPLKLVRDLRLAFRIPEYDDPIPGGSVARRITIRPAGLTIVYSHATFTARAHVLVPLEEPGGLILLEVETVRPLEVLVQMHADFNLAWPGGFGGGNISWQADRSLFLLTQGGLREYNGVVGSPFAVSGTSHPAHDAPLVPSQFVLRFSPEDVASGFIPIAIAGGVGPRDSVYATYARLLARAPAYWAEKAAYYANVRDSLFAIRTPDSTFDLAVEWAKVNLDRQRACNPDLGCGLVAGYGRAGAGNFRPGFGWYFAGDAAINSFAMDLLGQFDLVREGLAFSGRYQRTDGKIPHEISHAAARLPWFDRYPYTWFHGDTTPFWILACFEYWKASGDSTFIREHWPRLVKAFRWSAATDTDGDGLMENPAAGAGAIEVGGLGENLHTDIYLAGVWVAALEGLATMATAVGDAALAGEASALHQKARQSIDRRFWLESAGIYAFALLGGADGIRLNDALTVWPATAISFRQLDSARADRMLGELASSALTTDWGVRPLSQYHRLYEPLHYNNGAVWPFVTGFAALAHYRAHRGWAGFDLVSDVAHAGFDFARGRHPELMSGAYYRTLDTTVPDQFFATSMLVTPLTRGLLGLDPDASRCTLGVAPQLPAQWDSLAVRNVPSGCGRVAIALARTDSTYVVRLDRQDRGAGPLTVRVAPALPLGSTVEDVRVDGARVAHQLTQTSHDVSAMVTIPLADRAVIEVRFTGGASLLAPALHPAVGDPVQGLRIVNFTQAGGRYLVTVEGLSGRSYALEVRSAAPLRQVTGATPSGATGSRVRLEVRFDGAPNRYVRQEVSFAR